ncbi:transcription termination factor NusA [Candidatus Roizmanbacteria bacterium]|nr:transcription termination factor NusA [Candidatus Roizmanbacteria bacterium]
MSIVKSEFALALNQVATERGISPDDVISSIEAAILAAYRKEIPEDQEDTLTIKVNKETGEAKVLKDGKDITPAGFGRIAAQTAKQVILQKIREVEKKTLITHYKSQIGTVTQGRVIRYDGHNAFVDIGKVEAILPKSEQIKNEKYSVNTTLIFYIKEIAEDKFGNSNIIISRTAPQLIAELFKKEVPEIGNGTVEIKKVVREPGERAKIAVFSSQGGVDPVGACVGQKGVRVQTVTNELGGEEKIDIIQWNKDDKLFLIAALSPAKINEVETVEKKAKVTVEETQAPLAIGKNGVNVNLASALTGYEIDIVQIPQEKKPESPKAQQTKQIPAEAASTQKEDSKSQKQQPSPKPQAQDQKQPAEPQPADQPTT